MWTLIWILSALGVRQWEPQIEHEIGVFEAAACWLESVLKAWLPFWVKDANEAKEYGEVMSNFVDFGLSNPSFGAEFAAEFAPKFWLFWIWVKIFRE